MYSVWPPIYRRRGIHVYIQIYFYLLKVGGTIILKKVPILVIYFCLTKLVALGSNAVLWLSLTIWGWLGSARWVLPMFAVESSGSPKSLLTRILIWSGKTQATGGRKGRARAPRTSPFLSAVSPAYRLPGSWLFYILTQSLKVAFWRARQAKLYYLLWLVSDVPECHFAMSRFLRHFWGPSRFKWGERGTDLTTQ